jgi:hypothetical protein
MESHNITSCPRCELTVIADEMHVHKCRSVTDSRVVRNILWVSDGTRWYPLRITKRDAVSERNIPKGDTTLQKD